MALAFDAVSNGSGTGTINVTHTPVGTPRGIVAYVLYGAGADEVTAITYGGVSMSEVALSPLSKAAPEVGTVACYHLGASIPTGAQTVSLTVGGATAKALITISVTGAADTQVADTSIISSDAVANPSVTLSLGGVSCFCVIGFVSGQNAISGIAPTAGWTERFEFDAGTVSLGTYTYDTVSTPDVAAGWTQTSEDAVAIAVAISEISAAGVVGFFRSYQQAVKRASYY